MRTLWKGEVPFASSASARSTSSGANVSGDFLVKDTQVRTIEDMGGRCESFSYWFGSAVVMCQYDVESYLTSVRLIQGSQRAS